MKYRFTNKESYTHLVNNGFIEHNVTNADIKITSKSNEISLYACAKCERCKSIVAACEMSFFEKTYGSFVDYSKLGYVVNININPIEESIIINKCNCTKKQRLHYYKNRNQLNIPFEYE